MAHCRDHLDHFSALFEKHLVIRVPGPNIAPVPFHLGRADELRAVGCVRIAPLKVGDMAAATLKSTGAAMAAMVRESVFWLIVCDDGKAPAVT